MSKDYATLLAQVVPVFMLALGLEARSSWQSIAARSPDDKIGRFPLWVMGLFTTLQALLVATEMKALAVVANDKEYWSHNSLKWAIATVALLPCLQGVYVATRHRGRIWAGTLVVMAAGIAVVVGVSEYGAL